MLRVAFKGLVKTTTKRNICTIALNENEARHASRKPEKMLK